jgi:hypothetical protein
MKVDAHVDTNSFNLEGVLKLNYQIPFLCYNDVNTHVNPPHHL